MTGNSPIYYDSLQNQTADREDFSETENAITGPTRIKQTDISQSSNPVSHSARQRLDRPVVIPQVTPGTGRPFIRAYSTVLIEKGISIETFVGFIDDLNKALENSLPLQVVDPVGGVVGMVPYHIPAIVGGSLQASAKMAGAALNKSRSYMLLKTANAEIFAPHGLKIEIVTTKALKAKLDLDVERPLVAALEEDSDMSVQERRMSALEQFAAPLVYDVPALALKTNAIDKLSAAQLQRQVERSDKKILDKRRKALEKIEKAEAKSEVKKEKKKLKRERKGDKESEAAEKLLWLMVEVV